MPTTYTSLLGLALPATGELAGTWGTTVNDQITSLLDSAIAGTTTINTDADITLTTTTGGANQARQAIILWTANGTVTRNITAPAASKTYVVINASAGTQSIVIRGVGPTAGVTVLKGERVVVAWNGSDFVKVSSFGGTGTFTDLTVTGNTILGGAAGDTITVNGATTFTNVNPTLSAGTANGVLYLNGSKVATSGGSLTFDGTTFSVLGPITLSNNLGFISTAQRITGDMSSATIANRLAFQTSITNGNTSLMAIPNGTSTTCQVVAVNNSDPTNSSIGSIFITSTEVRVQSARLGTGTFLPLAFYTNSAEQARIDTSGNFLIGTTSNGADGLGISSLLNLTFPEGSGTSYANLFRQTSSAATVLANGYKRSATASGFASSVSASWAKTAIGLGVGTGDITFYADPAGTVANGTDVTPTERLRVKSTGQTRFLPLASDPSGAENGDVYYNSTTNKLRVRAGGAWVDLH